MDNQYNIVLEALTKASSQNAVLLKEAERQLKSWETERGFYTILLKIACDINVHVNIRWLSALCIKNGIDRYWRKSAPNSIDKDERFVIKMKLLNRFDEPVNQIALQFAVIISKVARFDFPREWPELFPTLLNGTQSANELEQQRALLTMHHVIKALSSKRLIADMHVFQQLTSTIFTIIFNHWINFSKLFLQEINGTCTKVKELLDNSLLTLKILRKLVTFGFKDISKEPDAVNFISLIFQQIGPFLDCRIFLQNKGNIFDVCEKYVVLLVKILRDVINLRPYSFVQFIQPTLECCITFCFNRDLQDKMYEKLIVQFMNVVKLILLCQEYQPSKRVEEKNQLTIEAHRIKTEFFTLPVLKEICDQLLTRYFLLTNEDIASWENNPEDLVSEEGRESWKFSLRPCTERLFLSLFNDFRNVLTPLVVEILQNNQNTKATDLLGILKRDAVYNAVGLAAFELFDQIDFDAWFSNVLINELQNKEPGYHIIRRRVIWLIGQWVGVKMSPENRPLLYDVILKMLNSDENLIVRIAASNALKLAIDDFSFNTEQILPYLEGFTAALFMLLKEVEECDLKMAVLHVLSFLIERTGSEVRPYADSLMHYLPLLWDTCGDHNMLRCAIISCFVHLVEGLGTMSESLQPLLIPMIALSTDVNQPPHVYLMEDGLELWWAVLDNTSSCSDSLLKLAENIFPLLEYKGDYLPLCIRITEAYIVLTSESFLKSYGQALVQTFQSAVTDMKSEGVSMLLKVVETVFILFPEEGPILFEPLLPYVLTLALDKEELPLCSTIQLSVLSRVILHNPNCFGRVLQAKANECQKDMGIVLDDLLSLWLDRMPISNPIQRKKLLGLALTCLLTSNLHAVHERICGILLAIIEVLCDVTKVDNENSSGPNDLLVINPGELNDSDDEVETERDKRKRELNLVDPVYTVVLRDYLYNQVMALQQSVGETKFQDLMSTVDVETMQELQVYLKNP